MVMTLFECCHVELTTGSSVAALAMNADHSADSSRDGSSATPPVKKSTSDSLIQFLACDLSLKSVSRRMLPPSIRDALWTSGGTAASSCTGTWLAQRFCEGCNGLSAGFCGIQLECTSGNCQATMASTNQKVLITTLNQES